MRKLYAVLFTAFVLFFSAADQASAQINYVFTTSAGNTIDPGTTLVPGSQADDASVAIALPFPYTAYGTVFNSVNAITNGNLQFQTAATSFTNQCPFPSTTNLGRAFMPHWDDLNMAAGGALGIYTSVSGTAPNRIFNIEWRALRFLGTLPVNFEARLFEGLERVDFVYGSVDLNGSSASIGLQGAISPSTLFTSFSCNTASLSSGLAISFVMPPPCTGVPSPGIISGPSAITCSPSSATLTVSGFSPGAGMTFQWKSSLTPGGPYTNIAGATSTTYAATAIVTTYYICTLTCTPSGLSSNTPEFTLNVSQPIHTTVSATPSTVCSPGATAISGTVTGGTLTGGIGVVGSSGTINLAIPDNNPAGITTAPIVVPATSIPNAASLKVRINVSHSFVGDLKFTLTSPCGTTFLFDRPGVPATTFGNGDNLGTSSATSPPPAVYTFDMAGATVIPETAGGAGFIAAGTYRPSDASGAAHSWAGLTFPCAAAGNWTLNISDNGGGDVGTLIDWAILAPGASNYTHTVTGPGTIAQNASTGANNSTANFSITGAPAGNQTYVLTSTDVLGCSVSSNVSVLVNQLPVITFTPAAPAVCTGSVVAINASAIPGTPQTLCATGLNAIPGTGTGATTGAPAALYPSNILVSGLPTANVVVKSISINNIIHTFPSDIDIVLRSPSGVNVVLLSDIGGSSALTGRTYTLDDAAATLLTTGLNATGTYRPTNLGATDTWPTPGPGSVTQATPTLASFGTGDMNGNWNLYIVDDANGDAGSISSWCITFTVLSPVTFSPITNLFTDNLATIAYTGTPAYTVYAKPTATSVYTGTYAANGCSTSTNVTVTVNTLPAITAQPLPATQTACPGTNVSYSVTATGAGLTYQWRRNGTNLSNGGLISGATSATLILTSVAAVNAGTYDVIVSGTCTPAVTSTGVVLTIGTVPTITTQPVNVTACLNGNAVFTVVAAGAPTPNLFQWQSSPDGITWTNLTTGGSYTSTLTVSSVTAAMNGTRYRVIITGNCGGQTLISNVVTLTVNAIPTVVATDLSAQRICTSDTLIPLVGTPIGGSWSGNGVSGFNFIPAATSVGSYILTYTYTNSLGCTINATTRVVVTDCPERIRLLSKDALKLYPNPNNGRFNIQMRSTLYNYLTMKVYNSSGHLMAGKLMKDAVTGNRTITSPTFNGLVFGRVVPIDLSYLPQGVYLIKFIYDDGIRTSDKTFTVIINRN